MAYATQPLSLFPTSMGAVSGAPSLSGAPGLNTTGNSLMSSDSAMMQQMMMTSELMMQQSMMGILRMMMQLMQNIGGSGLGTGGGMSGLSSGPIGLGGTGNGNASSGSARPGGGVSSNKAGGVSQAAASASPSGSGLSKVVSIAEQAAQMESKDHNYTYTQASGARTNNGKGPLSSGQNTFDCSGFVGAVYKAAGMADPYGNTGYAGTSFDIPKNGNSRMKPVSASQAKPGDVVVFPDHIAIYIGKGQCVSMGQDGDPKVVSVADEAAYENRGVQGYYAPVSS